MLAFAEFFSVATDVLRSLFSSSFTDNMIINLTQNVLLSQFHTSFSSYSLYRLLHFLRAIAACFARLSHGLGVRLSIRLSVCLSVTLLYRVKTVQVRITISSL